MKAFKLFRIRRDGSLGSLFINRKQIIIPNQWMQAENHPTKGYAYRPGWHATSAPIAPHLTMKGRRWYQVEIQGESKLKRPASQGTTWWIASQMKVLKEYNEAN